MNDIKYPIREKRHRLDEEVYKGGVIVFITACLKNREKIFVNDKIFMEFKKIIIQELKSEKCSSYIYLFLPDHLHIILSEDEDNSNSKKCFDRIKKKQDSGFQKIIKR